MQNRATQYADSRGLIEIYVGGAGDRATGIVKGYAEIAGGEYFSWDQASSIRDFIRNLPADEPVHLIGHSYGANTAAHVALALCRVEGALGCRKFDSLTTVDPVSRMRPDFKELSEKVPNWTNINAAPANRNFSDTIADIGGKWGDAPSGYANKHVSVNANLAEFRSMLFQVSERLP